MNVAGPSRRVLPPGRLTQRESVESTYEQDLLALLNQLSLDEMDEMQTFFTRRTDAGEPLSDHDAAMNDLLQQARALAAFNEDRMLAQRIAAGENDVGVEFQRPVTVQTAPRVPAVPQANGHGHRTATRQSENRQPTRNGTAPSQSLRRWFSSMVGWVFGSQLVSEPRSTQTSTTTQKTPMVKRATGHDCVICQDPIYGAEVRAPCGHYYDIGCITDLFQSATKDETLYPPRCCRQNIPFAQVQPHLSQTLLATFQEKQAEFSTLKRVYCSSPTCSRFLGPLSEGMFSYKVYTCAAPNCGRRTCGKCREQYTGDWTHSCRPDADAGQVLELSRASGWARCPGCSQMIELNVGCFHMTCRCRTEFCYLCHARWKTCACPQWDERRLLVAAEERVDAQFGVGQERGVRRDAPAQGARPAPAPAAPVFVPARNPYAPMVPRPDQPQRPAAAPAPATVPVRFVAPTRTPAAGVLRPQPTPARITPTASSSIGRPTVTPTVSTRTPTSKPASISVSTRSTPASTSTLAATPTPASASSSSGQSRWHKSTLNTDATRQRLVREMMERLRVDHECDHAGRWRYRKGGGICQTCGHHLPLYLFRCQGCEMLACNRCRRNRL